MASLRSALAAYAQGHNVAGAREAARLELASELGDDVEASRIRSPGERPGERGLDDQLGSEGSSRRLRNLAGLAVVARRVRWRFVVMTRRNGYGRRF